MTVDVLDFDVLMSQLWRIDVSPTPEHQRAIRELVEITIELRGGEPTDTLDAKWLHTAQVATSRGPSSPLGIVADPELTREVIAQVRDEMAALGLSAPTRSSDEGNSDSSPKLI